MSKDMEQPKRPALSELWSGSLLKAIANKDVVKVVELLRDGTNVEKPKMTRVRRFFSRDEDPSPLIAAAHVQSVEIVRLLISHGADPNIGMTGWGTALSTACYHGNQEIAQVLLEHGAEINLTIPNCGSPIEQAAWYRHEQLVVFLLSRGAQPDLVLKNGVGSLLRVSGKILSLLVAAGGQSNERINELIQGGERLELPD